LLQRCRPVEHVIAVMLFRYKDKCHEICFETDCKLTVVRRNLVGYTVVLMPIYEEDFKIHQRLGGYSIANESNSGMTLVQLTNQASSYVTTLLIKKL
jgi:hypothetical protein